ncbi:MAG: XRE family transcriptional regulator [Roseinatronobacter sp.]
MKYPHSETRLAKFISKRIDELKGTKAQVEIATQAGFTNPNFLSMLKAGSSKLPIDRVPDMARALDADPAYLLRLTLEQQLGPVAARAVDDLLGTPLSKNERAWIEELRDASDNLDPTMTKKSRGALRAIFGK